MSFRVFFIEISAVANSPQPPQPRSLSRWPRLQKPLEMSGPARPPRPASPASPRPAPQVIKSRSRDSLKRQSQRTMKTIGRKRRKFLFGSFLKSFLSFFSSDLSASSRAASGIAARAMRAKRGPGPSSAFASWNCRRKKRSKIHSEMS